MARTKSYFEMEKFAMRICGISFREQDSKLYKISTGILLFNVCLYPCLAVGDLFKHDYEVVADLLTYEFSIFVGVIKVITVLFNRKKIAKLLNKVDRDLSLSNFTSEDGDDEQLMKKCVTITTAQTAVYWIFAFLSYVFAFVYTLTKRIRSNDYHDWQFPYGTFTILNVTHSPNYEVSWAYQVWNCFFIGILFTTIDLIMAAVLCHVCYRLKILQNHLRAIVENSYKKMENVNNLSVSTLMETDNFNQVANITKEWKNLHAPLTVMVEYHLEIINVTKEADESFSALLLLVYLGTLGILAFMAYKASLIPLNDVRMLRSFAELTIVVLQVFMVCFWSEQMVFEGEQVGAAAFEANFIGTDLRFQKSLILIIRRSQMPIRLTAGFVDISLSTFTWILRTTYSAFMILRKHNLKDD